MQAKKTAIRTGLVGVIGATLLASCSSAPDCSSGASLKQVEAILKGSNYGFMEGMMIATRTAKAKLAQGPQPNEANNQMYYRVAREVFAASTLSFSAVRTISKDPATGTVRCVANLDTEFPNGDGGFTADVMYQIERTADGKDYVSVFENPTNVSQPRPPK